MDVLFLGPGYPGEMPLFTRGLAEVGARVVGVGDQPAGDLPETARQALSDYVQIGSFADEDAATATIPMPSVAATSTSSRRCGNRRSCSPPDSASASACPACRSSRRSRSATRAG
jgi:hypothetical protein